MRKLISTLVVTILQPVLTAQSAQYEIEQSWDISTVVSEFPVGFCLLTEGQQQYAAYFDADRNMTVASRQLRSDQWQYKVLPSRVKWDSHNYITMAVDSDGHLHVSGNMHNVPLIYFRTEKPGDISTLNRATMTGELEKRATYPKFIVDPDGRLIFNYRNGGSGRGMRLYNIYNTNTRTWKRLLDTPLLDGEGKRNAYPRDPVLGPDGWYHIAWVWRHTPDAATNHDLSHARSKDLIHWESSFGEPVDLPILFDQEALKVDRVPSGGGLLNSAVKLTFGSDKRPLIIYHKHDPDGNMQLFAARPDDAKWQIRQLTSWGTRVDFGGGGSLGYIGLRFHSVKLLEPGLLTLAYRHKDYGNGRLFVDEATLQPLEIERDLTPEFPEALSIIHSDFSVKKINSSAVMGDYGDGYCSYILQWETLGTNRDRPRKPPLPEPATLKLYKLRKAIN